METLIDSTKQESKRFSKRSMICALFVLIFFFVVLLRLGYLQLVEHHFYATLSKHNIISVIPVKPDRGFIYDRHHILLAKNVPIYSLMVIPGRAINLKKTIQQLMPIMHFTPEELKTFYRSLKLYHRYQTVPLKETLTETQVDQFYVNQYRFPGVLVQTNMIRKYPWGKVMSNVIGYVGRINANELTSMHSHNYTASDDIGKAGVEAAQEKRLHGTLGAAEAEIDASGKQVRILKITPPIPGKNIYLTIDVKLQKFAEKALGKNSGAIVIIQPDTGQVLALATNPNFDPNVFVTGISQKAYQTLLRAQNHPLFNRATRGLYSPGSVVKPFVAFYALRKKIITSQDHINDHGWFRIPGTKHIFHDWKRVGHGWVNVTRALMISCDTFFYQLAAMMGVKRLDDALFSFGFGRQTGLDLPGERAGLLPTPHWKWVYKGRAWYTGDTILTGIGQGFMLTTPLQLAVATASLAEHGKKIKPVLFQNIRALRETHRTTGKFQGKEPRFSPLSHANSIAWKTVTKGMRAVISNPVGTAWAFGRNAPYAVAGKTGTAQVFGTNRDEERSRTNVPKKLRNNHLFIGFAPIKHPKVAIAVVVEHASFADRIARKVLDYYFKRAVSTGRAVTKHKHIRLPKRARQQA